MAKFNRFHSDFTDFNSRVPTKFQPNYNRVLGWDLLSSPVKYFAVFVSHGDILISSADLNQKSPAQQALKA